MENHELDKSDIKRMPAKKRKPVCVSQQQLIKTGRLQAGCELPLVIEPAIPDIRLAAWAANNREFIEESLLKHGAILFRNFDVSSATEFEEVIKSVSGAALEYRERSSPRSKVSGNIYTSTDYPPDQSIFLHNEHSYSRTFPLRIFFCCVVPARQGGETPIADCRGVYRRIPVGIRERFEERKWMYVRNFGDGFGLPWQTAFQTTDPAKVEAYCREKDIEFEWKDADHLRTRQVRPAIAIHPKTGEAVWFNHATFFHVSTLSPTIRDALLDAFGPQDLPNNTYYGDGSPIEPEVLDILRDAYRQECVRFPWQKGDLLALDNMLTAHARSPYEGAREVLVGMSEPFTRADF